MMGSVIFMNNFQSEVQLKGPRETKHRRILNEIAENPNLRWSNEQWGKHLSKSVVIPLYFIYLDGVLFLK